MKNFLNVFGVFIGLCAFSSAQALEFQCGKTLEILPIQRTEEPTIRPSLVEKVITRPDGSIIKKYKPLAAGNEAVADFLLGIRSTTKVCIKYYDPFLPAPIPLTILDIYVDNN